MGTAEILIGELSRQTRCDVETIRYYERIGVLPKPARNGRYRCYGTTDIARLVFVRRARALGFTLDEVRALIKLSGADGRSACGEVRQLAVSHLGEVKAKIADLRAMERALTEAVRRCDDGERPRCPVIETLSATFDANLSVNDRRRASVTPLAPAGRKRRKP